MSVRRSPSRLAARTAALLAIACVLAPVAGYAAALSGTVVTVIDGDTVVVRDAIARRHEVRIAGIDAPEMRQAYGARSRRHLAELLYGRAVTVSWYKHDRYGRVLARIAVGVREPCGAATCTRQVDVGHAQIAAGLAWHDREHLDEQTAEERVRYGRAEQDARARRAGLWAEARPMPPWRYRHLHPRRTGERAP